MVYVTHPVSRQYEWMNIYIPEAYFTGGKIDGFSAENALIFFPNQVGGYMPAEPDKPGIDERSKSANTMLVALSKGYVVASSGARAHHEK